MGSGICAIPLQPGSIPGLSSMAYKDLESVVAGDLGGNFGRQLEKASIYTDRGTFLANLHALPFKREGAPPQQSRESIRWETNAFPPPVKRRKRRRK